MAAAKNHYAFKLFNCKVPHWKKGKIVREEQNSVFLENCPFAIRKKDLYTNEKEALMDFVKEVNRCSRNNIEGIYGKEDIAAYQKGKHLLLKESLKKIETHEQAED